MGINTNISISYSRLAHFDEHTLMRYLLVYYTRRRRRSWVSDADEHTRPTFHTNEKY